MKQALLIWLGAANLLGFVLMGADKRRARKHLRRIPERTLFLSAILGGSVGAIAGMWTFRHKTKHWYFSWGFPILALLQLALCFWLFWKGGGA